VQPVKQVNIDGINDVCFSQCPAIFLKNLAVAAHRGQHSSDSTTAQQHNSSSSNSDSTTSQQHNSTTATTAAAAATGTGKETATATTPLATDAHTHAASRQSRAARRPGTGSGWAR
jgi:hypothetical protein